MNYKLTINELINFIYPIIRTSGYPDTNFVQRPADDAQISKISLRQLVGVVIGRAKQPAAFTG